MHLGQTQALHSKHMVEESIVNKSYLWDISNNMIDMIIINPQGTESVAIESAYQN